MKRIIKGDKNLSHLVIAHAAIDRHAESFGQRRQGWPLDLPDKISKRSRGGGSGHA